MRSVKVLRSWIAGCVTATTLIFLLGGTSLAEENLPSVLAQPDSINGEYLKGYLDDTGKMLTSPTSWDNSDWLKAALVVGTTSGIYFADRDIKGFAQRNQGKAADKVADVGNALGNPLYTLPSLGLFYIYGNLYEDPKARRVSLLAVESLAISGAFTFTLKLATQRPRPFTGAKSDRWDGPSLKSTDSAFPSIHTQSSFSIASVIAEEYGDNQYVAPIVYGLATLTGLSRVYDNKHWASDVLFGAAIGYFTGKAVIRYHSGTAATAVRFMPTVSQDGVGVTAEYRF